MTLRTLTLALITLTAACADLDGDQPESAPESVSEQAIAGGGCAEWACGTNSPEIANFGFWEMAAPVAEGTIGLPNNAGLQIIGFVKKISATTYASYLPRVLKGKLVGFPMSTNVAPYTVAIRGNDLVNGYFLIQTPSGPFKLWVKGVGEVRSWAQPPGTVAGDPLVYLESYLLDWSNMQGEVLTNVCNHPGGRDDLGLMTGPLSYHTLLFEGDRIRASKKEIYGIDTQWFNFGCAGSALAKMALTGHTEASKLALTFDTTVAERQTMLKMLTADYCGDGTPFTVQGQPLNWADDHGTMKMPALAASPPRPVFREARWTASGPACLDAPRVDVYWTSLGETTFGASQSVYAQAAHHCPRTMPPACTGSTLSLGGYHLITATEPHAGPP